ncbi:hypothetical protein X747_28915 [Mesorhizobium sp. LNJC384A00]|nr:hypothetical protein X747_28915 [Mesorhizobium sp. LNJC384A00]
MEALRTGALVLKATNETAIGRLGAGAVERLSGHIELDDAKARIANGEPALPVAGGLVARMAGKAALAPVAEVVVRGACIVATDAAGMVGCGIVAGAAQHQLTKALDFTQSTGENFLKNLDEGSSLTVKNAGEPGWANTNAAFADNKPSINGGPSGIVQYNFGGDGTENQLAGMQPLIDAMKSAVEEASAQATPEDSTGDTECLSGASYADGGCVSEDSNGQMEEFSDASGPTLEDMLRNSAAQQQQQQQYRGRCSGGMSPAVNTPNPQSCF